MAVPPVRLDPFQRIINVSWNRPVDEYIVFAAGAYVFGGKSTTADVTIGAGINQFTVSLLDGLADKSIKSPAVGPLVTPDVAWPNWNLNYTEAMRQYNYIAFTQELIVPEVVNGELSDGGRSTLLFVRRQFLLDLFGPIVPFTMGFEFNDFSTSSVLFQYHGQVFNLPATNPPGFGAVFSETQPVFSSSAGPGQSIDLVVGTEVGGEGLQLDPPGEFVGALNLLNYTVTDLTP